MEEQGGTSFQELFIDSLNGRLESMDLQFYPGVKINGIAYHPSQNLIYGVLLGKTYRLCRIDGQHQMTILRELPLPENLLFVSGDVSPDERYLVLLGYSPDEPSNMAALIDLTDPDFPTRLIPLTTTSPEHKKIYCADIAFHPTTDRLFGFDDLTDRIITIDLENGMIDNTSYPSTSILRGNVPSIFFDAWGHLYGIGVPDNSYAANRNFYYFDVEDGSVSLRDQLNVESNQDACSCPFKVKLLNRVSSRKAAACTELTFEFTLINRTDRIQRGVTFTDTFPSYTRIRRVEPLPFSGQIVSGTGTNQLEIRNIELPVGSSTFSITLEVLRDAPLTTVLNTAYLDGILLDDLEASVQIHSDDPETPRPEDPTYFAIGPLDVSFPQSEFFICPDSTLEIQAIGPQDAEYRWDTGTLSPSLTVSAPGSYRVTVSSGCETAMGVITVSPSQIQLDLGKERLVEKGQALEILPETTSTSRIHSYSWSSPSPRELQCQHCDRQLITPYRDTELGLQVMNEDGCVATDVVKIRVTDFGLFAPNAFSPNGDQINDVFYLQSRQEYTIRSMRIFDRWGSLVYRSLESHTNQTTAGWDGRSRGQLLRAGVYIWTAEIISLSGKTVQLSGEVNLIR